MGWGGETKERGKGEASHLAQVGGQELPRGAAAIAAGAARGDGHGMRREASSGEAVGAGSSGLMAPGK